jgi:hypothetical protein
MPRTDRPCRFPECPNRVGLNTRYCGDCRKVMAEQLRALNDVLFPPRQPYTPRVCTVAPFEERS